MIVLQALYEKPLGLKVLWVKTKLQALGSLLDEAVLSSKRIARILRSWKIMDFENAVQNNGGSRKKLHDELAWPTVSWTRST